MKFDVKVPSVGESITEVTIGRWLKSGGDFVESDEVICEIESEKATLELRSEKEGRLKIVVGEGETVPIGHKIGEIDTTAQKPKPVTAGEDISSAETEEPPVLEAETPAELSGKQSRISPVAAKLLEEAGLKPSDIQGSGAGGRITKTDVQKAIDKGSEEKPVPEKKLSTQTGTGKETVSAQPGVVPRRIIRKRTESRVKMSTLRKTIARRLVAARNETAMLTTFNELDMSKIIEVRNSYKDLFLRKYDLKLGFMSFFIKACTLALAEFPEVNAMIEEEEIVYHDYCDVSLAVSTPKGLVVPVIFDADLMNLAQLEAEVDRLATKARDNKLTIEEMTGGTFSITNGGVFGSLLSTPLINAPQTAILGMHKIEERPVALNGQVVIRPMMYLALSYDHRLIDGKESVNFLVRVKELLEDPTRILLEI